MLEPFDVSQIGLTPLYLQLVPYEIGRKTLYSADDLYGPDHYDERVYDCYIHQGKQPSSTRELLARSIHDYCIRKSLEDFMEGRDPLRSIGVMGGHGLSRRDPRFITIARIAQRLTELGYLMITGGGPGAMEATHLGAWMAGRTDDELSEAWSMLSACDSFEGEGWLATAFAVRERYPQHDFVSLGVPTWLYGHEPATPLATHIAKFFDNSLREDFIITASYGGILYTPGSAGTVQEIFQDAVQNHYLSFGFASPMVFLDQRFWTDDVPVYPLLNHLLDTGRYRNLLLTLTDDADEVIRCFTSFVPTCS